jgi:hypothetical protein
MRYRVAVDSSFRVGLCLALGLVLGMIRTTRGATPVEVEAALQKAKTFLYSQQNKDGDWEKGDRKEMHGSGRMWGGQTALATYALLAAGESPQDPRLQKALDFLYKTDIDLIYGLGLRGQIWNLLPPGKQTLTAAKRDRDLLLQAVNRRQDEPGWGLYHYGVGRGPVGRYHNSTAQYGVLGMWGVELAGAEVPADYWKLVDTAWKKNQDPSGGWSYEAKVTPGEPPKTSMTAAGVATLFITQDYLFASEGIKCIGNINNPHIEAGLKFISDHYRDVNGELYTMYGVERIGVASGYKYFGENDWYASGAEWLVRNQSDNGSWKQKWDSVPDTSFGIVFLSRGRAPVMFNKLDYGEPSIERMTEAEQKLHKLKKQSKRNWNQRPRDAANVARWLGDVLERPLNWQIVNLRVQSVDELHDAPILYISGDSMLDFTADEVARLKQFVEQGGLIFGNADCGKGAFVQSFIRLGRQMFPRYEFRNLPNDHVIYTRQLFPMKEGKHVGVMGLSNGVRELILLIPRQDVARSWQLRSDRTKKEAYQIAANIFLYAVDKKNLRNKGETYIVQDKDIKPEKTITLARLMVGVNPNPEPGGWPRLNAILKNDDKVALDIVEAKLGEGKLSGVKVAHLTGTSDFKLDEPARKELAAFIKAGGTLIVDAASGSPAFADAAERELDGTFAQAFPKQALELISAKHALYTNWLVGLKDVGYRTFARDLIGAVNAPRIKGLKLDGGRLGAFYSREDLSAGLVGQPVDGIRGYDPATATRLMRAMLLYALYDGKLPKAPPTQPATAPTSQPTTTASQ